jgi:hypothetical protein
MLQRERQEYIYKKNYPFITRTSYICNTALLVGFEVFTAAPVKSTVFRDVVLRSLVEVQHFGGTYCLQLQGRRASQTTSKKQVEPASSACCLAYSLTWKMEATSTGLYGITSETTVIYNSSYLYSCMKKDYLKTDTFQNY